MGPKAAAVLIDTNVFVIDLRYRRDRNYKSNRVFLDTIARQGKGFTTLVNLLELCGILSFNLNENQLHELWHYFHERYKITVLPSFGLDEDFPSLKVRQICDVIKQRVSFGDALMLTVAKNHLSFISTLITWDKEHYEGKFSGNVLTPEEFGEIDRL